MFLPCFLAQKRTRSRFLYRYLEEILLKNSMKLRSGATIYQITSAEAEKRNYLTRQTLTMLHLMPAGDPVAYNTSDDGNIIYYFDSEHVTEAPPETWYFPTARKDSMTLPSGTVIPRMSTKNAAASGFYCAERLRKMHYEPIEEPVAYTVRSDKTILYFYDKRTANKLPQPCAKCGKDIRFKRKLCKACYEEDMAIKRIEGDAHRNAFYNMDRARILFFDLELTGFYDHDEILSITIIDGFGNHIMDTLVKPVSKKSWKRTEEIHKITPAMVVDAPTLSDLVPELKRIFADAENVIAYGVSTDYSHIKKIYKDEAEREEFHKKIRCCANEFVRYTHEHRPDVLHASLTDAMSCFEIEWEGVAHSSVADTIGCRKVWEVLFPNYYCN